MARTKQRLINYHTTGTTIPSTGDVQGGEIVVRNNEAKPELLIRAGSGFAVFEASGAVQNRIESAIEAAQTNLEGQIDALTEATGTLNTAISDVSGAVKTNYALKSEVTAVENKLTGHYRDRHRERQPDDAVRRSGGQLRDEDLCEQRVGSGEDLRRHAAHRLCEDQCDECPRQQD